MTFGLGLRHNGKKTAKFHLTRLLHPTRFHPIEANFDLYLNTIFSHAATDTNLKFPLEQNDFRICLASGYILILKEKAITFRNTTGFRIPSTRCENSEL